jgi:hypothetical protein
VAVAELLVLAAQVELLLGMAVRVQIGNLLELFTLVVVAVVHIVVQPVLAGLAEVVQVVLE